ncbi:MAG TPA: ATP-binding protein [Terriglobales bacterium]|nr:ATP-binding protein [Terriglobales bacterium]
MSRRSKLWILFVSSLVCLQVAASIAVRGFALVVISDLTQFALTLSGALALWPRVKDSRGRARIFWALMMFGVGIWMVYQGCWCYFEIVLRQEVPSLFAPDALLFLHLVPMIAALAMQPDREQDEWKSRVGSLDFLMLAIWWIYLYLISLVPWFYVHPDPNIYQHNLNIVYLVEKLALLGGLALLWSRSSGYWKRVYAQWFGCTLAYGLSSYLANWAIERGVYYTGCAYDIPLAASIGWVTWIGLRSVPKAEEPALLRSGEGYGVWVARLGMMGVLSLPLFAAWSVFNTEAPHPVRRFRVIVSLATMLVLGVLVFCKQHLLDRELLRLLKATQEAFADLQRLQAQLVQAEKLASLGQLVGGAAHELNNPLTAMLGYVELLASTSLNDEQRPWLQKIEQQVRRIRTLVSSLLSFAVQVPAEKVPLDINALVQTAVKLYPPQLHGAAIQVHTDLASNLPRVLADSNQLLQVCLHITNNALHAMAEKGGVLDVCTRAKDDAIVIEFSDRGPGVKDPKRVFDPFYTTRPVGQGAGLGLSVCYGIIREHNGQIVCENRPQGGATFRIELPIIMRSAPAPLEASPSSHAERNTAAAQ